MSAYAPTLLIQVRDSASLRASLLLLHALAAATLLSLASSVGHAALWTALLVPAVAWRARGRQPPLRWVVLRDGAVVLVDEFGRAANGSLERGSIVLPGIILLAVRDDSSGTRRHLALPCDGLMAEEARRLRARLRLAA